jgi:SAM-dependent methyltransferase
VKKDDNNGFVGFEPSKKQKGLCEEIWKNYLPENIATIIDLGCGWNKLAAPRKGDIVFGVDHTHNEVIDVLCDIDSGICLKNDSVDAVYTKHCLEHIKNKDYIFQEIHRILKPGSIAFIKVPHFRGVQAYNYDHITRWASFSMNTFANAKWYSSDFPYFEIIMVGIKWRLKTGPLDKFIDWIINKSFTLSETWLWYPLGGFFECQYLIRKPA